MEGWVDVVLDYSLRWLCVRRQSPIWLHVVATWVTHLGVGPTILILIVAPPCHWMTHVTNKWQANCWTRKPGSTWTWTVYNFVPFFGPPCTRDDSIYRKYRYIVFNIDVSYRIVKKYRIFWYIVISFICHDIYDIYRDILCQKFIFLLLHYQNNENKWRKRQTNQSKLTIVS